MTIIVSPSSSAPIFVGVGRPPVIDIDVGVSGPPGPQGPEGGTAVVPVPYNEWPPVDPVPDTLYLRLAP